MSHAPATLVLFAAGLGTRYGGDKQWAALGPGGQRLLDYTLHDAVRAGFDRALLVVRPEAMEQVRDKMAGAWSSRLLVDAVPQSLDRLPEGFTLPEGRVKPWGTGHALWCALQGLEGAFFVANADDFYGREAIALARRLLERIQASGLGKETDSELGSNALEDSPLVSSLDGAIVAYPLGATLSTHGGVSRGICRTDPDGRLTGLTERTGLRSGDVSLDPTLDVQTPVSMNLTGFHPKSAGPAADRAFREFLFTLQNPLTDEFPITAVLDELIRAGAFIQVTVTSSPWMGVTYAEDAPRVRRRLLELHQAGAYPDAL